jgi:3-isopropylmalate/(R)-2-methylmalate dehydratase large subunit
MVSESHAVGCREARTVRFPGRILYLTQDPRLIERQLAGEDLAWDPSIPLLDNISTDEITPAWVCFYYDETLGRYALVGLRGGTIEPDAIKRGGFSVIVSGLSKGCGSSRETAPYAELAAGVKLVLARSIEKIYGQNAQNIGLLTSTDFDLLPRIARGEAIPIDEFTRGLDPISAAIVERGGLFEYNKLRLKGALAPPPVETPARPMTLVEKIIASHAVADAREGRIGVRAVKPGDALFARTDVRFSHEYVTPMAESLFVRAFGPEARVRRPETVTAFRDHLTFVRLVMPERHRKMGLLERAEALAVTQRSFCERQGIRLYDERPDGGSEAICHNAVIEDIARPGDLIAGTDSHTCTAGALGCFAFGVGATDMANAWFTEDVRVRVPETALFRLRGRPAPGVLAKDIMLFIMSLDWFKTGEAIGKVLEFEGEGLRSLSMDERATLTNMAVEAGAFTGVIAADETTIRWIQEMRGLSDREADELRARSLRSDPGARYCRVFEIDLASLVPMVATPGDPRNGVPISQLPPDIKIDIAYGGSCTGGKMADMDEYASVLRAALARGERVAEGVQFYLQFGSQKIKRYAEKKGYIEIFRAAGATLIDPSCGACIRAGPGTSTREDEVTVSAQNRNFPGRSGPGKVYLANPRVVAASAIAGRIVAPREDVRAPEAARR